MKALSHRRKLRLQACDIPLLLLQCECPWRALYLARHRRAGAVTLRAKIPDTGNVDMHGRLAVLDAQGFMLHDPATPYEAAAIARSARCNSNLNMRHGHLPNTQRERRPSGSYRGASIECGAAQLLIISRRGSRLECCLLQWHPFNGIHFANFDEENGAV